MKKLIVPLIMVILLLLVFFNLNKISLAIIDFFSGEKTIVILPSNDYTLDYEFRYVKKSEDYVPYSYGDLLNIYYSVLNNGWDTFTFYCPNEYSKCISDVEKISNDDKLLTHINNYIHPFNNFSSLRTSYDNTGEVTINIEKLYSKEEIELLSKKADEIIEEVMTSEINNRDYTNEEDKLYDIMFYVHDYIINNTKYDIERNKTGNSPYKSTTAYGPYIEGYGMCGGYADAMAIVLNKLGIENYKIAVPPDSDEEDDKGHVWNAVKFKNKWLHLDLTFDDPVDEESGKDYLNHYYFLVNSEALIKQDKDYIKHEFDVSIYREYKDN